jgi:hypothetical protein
MPAPSWVGDLLVGTEVGNLHGLYTFTDDPHARGQVHIFTDENNPENTLLKTIIEPAWMMEIRLANGGGVKLF